MNCRPVAGILGLISNILILWSLVSPRWSTSLPITTSGQPIRVGFWFFQFFTSVFQFKSGIHGHLRTARTAWNLFILVRADPRISKNFGFGPERFETFWKYFFLNQNVGFLEYLVPVRLVFPNSLVLTPPGRIFT